MFIVKKLFIVSITALLSLFLTTKVQADEPNLSSSGMSITSQVISVEVDSSDFNFFDMDGNPIDSSEFRVFEQQSLSKAMTVEKTYKMLSTNYHGAFSQYVYVTLKATQKEKDQGVFTDWTGYVAFQKLTKMETLAGIQYTGHYSGTLTAKAR